MKNNVTIVPDDRLIIIDGAGLIFDYASPANIHALQWHDGKGHIEFTDGKPNQELQGEADYTEHVAPFVALWEAEQARLKQEAKEHEAQAEAEYNKPEAQAKRIRDKRDELLNETNWLVERHSEQTSANIAPSLTDMQYKELLNYRQALRDVPQADGFPWGGNVENAEYPKKPDFV